jgi:hypothetical protein
VKTKTETVCKACRENRHDECSLADCECPDYQQRKAIEHELEAVSRADSAYAEVVLSNLQYSGSNLAKLVIDEAGRDAALAFVHQILRTATAMKC